MFVTWLQVNIYLYIWSYNIVFWSMLHLFWGAERWGLYWQTRIFSCIIDSILVLFMVLLDLYQNENINVWLVFNAVRYCVGRDQLSKLVIVCLTVALNCLINCNWWSLVYISVNLVIFVVLIFAAFLNPYHAKFLKWNNPRSFHYHF